MAPPLLWAHLRSKTKQNRTSDSRAQPARPAASPMDKQIAHLHPPSSAKTPNERARGAPHFGGSSLQSSRKLCAPKLNQLLHLPTCPRFLANKTARTQAIVPSLIRRHDQDQKLAALELGWPILSGGLEPVFVRPPAMQMARCFCCRCRCCFCFS